MASSSTNSSSQQLEAQKTKPDELQSNSDETFAQSNEFSLRDMRKQDFVPLSAPCLASRRAIEQVETCTRAESSMIMQARPYDEFALGPPTNDGTSTKPDDGK